MVSEVLKWISNYYVDYGIKDPEDVQKKINSKEYPSEIYLLTFPTNPKNVLDLFPVSSLKYQAIEENCPQVVGIAKGKQAAIDLAGKIILECNHKTGTFRVEEYLKNR